MFEEPVTRTRETNETAASVASNETGHGFYSDVTRHGDGGDRPSSFWEVPESFKGHKFPRWSSSSQGEVRQAEGIHMPSILEFLDDLLIHPEQIHRSAPDAFVYVWGATDGNNSIEKGSEGIWVSESVRTRVIERRSQVLVRLERVEVGLQRAWNFLKQRMDDSAAQSRWPMLVGALRGANRSVAWDDPSRGLPGFPLIFWHLDYTGCNLHNFKGKMSVPYLTTCASVRCNHSFPFPNYETIKDSLPNPASWDVAFDEQNASHPWSGKVRQIVWRGTLTGKVETTLTNPTPRVRLGMFAADHRSNPLIDIGIRGLPRSHAGDKVSSEILRRIEMKPSMPFENFANYMAILDIDGNSWSSRFGKLLCINSVIVKVEPGYVDYFYKYLEPWSHYVPVRSDLSDLLEKIEWVLDPSNERRVLQIVSSANSWCRTHMTRQHVIRDMLDVLNAYVGLLDQGDARWADVWAERKARMWDPASGWEMQRLEKIIQS